MVAITFASEPSGAELEIEGESCGQMPVEIETSVGLAEFREECVAGGVVSCEWDMLKVRLEDPTVSNIWWDLTFDERYSIAYMAASNVFNFMVKYFKRVPGCGFGSFEHIGECSSNTTVRFCMFDHLIGCLPESGCCFWKRDNSDVWHNYTDLKSYNLPCYFAASATHVMAAIGLNQPITTLQDLFIFQYNEIDIQPGCLQLPYGGSLTIQYPTEVSCTGYRNSDIIAIIDVPTNGEA